MRFSFFPVVILLSSVCSPGASLHSQSWKPQATSGVIVGVLKWQDKSLPAFSDRHRKDKELYETLIRRGVPPDRLRLLLDAEGTKARIISEIGKTAALGSDFFFLYYAGHGIQDRSGAYLANYDIESNHPSTTGLKLEDLAGVILANFKGSTVFLSGDFCFSGALQAAARRLSQAGKQAIVLTSADASNISTGNWTFSQTLIDCLSGDSLCDRNRDGHTTLSEMQAEVADAMRFREMQRSGFAIYGTTGELVFAESKPAHATNGRFAIGSYVLAPRRKGLATARVMATTSGKASVEFYSYSDKERADVAEKDLRPIEFRRLPVGTSTSVLWNEVWYKSRVLKTEDDFHFISYDGYGPEWNEWVMSNRILDPSTVMIQWQGKWYPGKIQKTDGGKSLVSYDGYGSDWDEWVTEDRIKRP